MIFHSYVELPEGIHTYPSMAMFQTLGAASEPPHKKFPGAAGDADAFAASSTPQGGAIRGCKAQVTWKTENPTRLGMLRLVFSGI